MAKSFNTGFLDIVELRIAKRPIKQRAQKALSKWFFDFETITNQLVY